MTIFWRGLALLWLPASILVAAIALIHLFNLMHPGAVAWAPIVATPVELYGDLVGRVFTPVHDMVLEHASFGLPVWTADLATAYAASASACALAGTTLAKRDGVIDGFKSSTASLGWPLAILLFLFTSIKNRVVTRFAAEHTTLFVLYLIAVAAVIAAAFYADKLLGTGAA